VGQQFGRTVKSFASRVTVFNDSDNDSLPDELPEGYIGNLTEDDDDDNDGYSDSQKNPSAVRIQRIPPIR